MEQNLETLEPKSVEVFLKKSQEDRKIYRNTGLKQPGETGKSIYYNLLIYENYIGHTI